MAERSRRAGKAAALAAGLLLAACSPEAPAAPPVVLELERLTFVPPGSTSPWVLPEDVGQSYTHESSQHARPLHSPQ